MHQKGFVPILIILVAVIFLAISAGWLYAGLAQHTQRQSTDPHPGSPLVRDSLQRQAQGFAGQPSSSQITADSSEQTYTNGRYGFELQYPRQDIAYEQYGCSLVDLDTATAGGGAVVISAGFFFQDPKPYDNFNAKYYQSRVIGQETLGGYSWTEYIYGPTNDNPQRLVYSLFNDGLLVKVDEPYKFPGDAEVRTILATFRRTDSSVRLDKAVETVGVGSKHGAVTVMSVEIGNDPAHNFLPTNSFLPGADNTVIKFMGQLTVKGKYDITRSVDSEDISFEPASAAMVMIPVWDYQCAPSSTAFAFNNNDFALQAIAKAFYNGNDPLGEQSVVSGTATIVVNNLVESITSQGTLYSFDLVAIVGD